MAKIKVVLVVPDFLSKIIFSMLIMDEKCLF